MNAKIIFLLSCLLNVALGACIFVVVRPPPPAPDVPEAVPATPPSPPTLTAAVEVSAPTPVPRVESFEWAQVWDADFARYRDRLLGRGCPPSTMRVIVEAEINLVYSERRRGALAALQTQFWDLIGQGPDKLIQSARAITQPIEQERRKLITAVLGEDRPNPDEADRREQALANDRARYAWLPEEKRDRMLALEKQLNDADAEMWRWARENNKDRQPAPEARARQKELKEQIKQARQQLLTPEEFQEFELRSSGAAGWAMGIADFEPTEQEWHEVGQVYKRYYDAIEELRDTKPVTQEEKQRRSAELKRIGEELESARTAALGPERASAFARSVDGDFRQVRAVLQKYNLEDGVAREVYALQQIAMQQANALRANTALPAEAREAALRAIRQETERTLEQTMGAKAFNTYRKFDDGWFSRLQSAGR